MDTENEGDTGLMVMCREDDIPEYCRQCGKPLTTGNYTVGVIFDSHAYLVGHNPPLVCCGVKREPPLLFEEKEDADDALRKVVETFIRDGNFDNISLLIFSEATTKTLH